jgi:PAS domain-containing protein
MNELPDLILKRAQELAHKHPDELVSVYSMDEKCRWASPSHQTILGYPPADSLGKSWKVFVAPEDHAHASLAGDDALLHGKSIEFGLVTRTKAGERVPMRGQAWITMDQNSGTGYLFFRARRAT